MRTFKEIGARLSADAHARPRKGFKARRTPAATPTLS
jgi:hypothetical protein